MQAMTIEVNGRKILLNFPRGEDSHRDALLRIVAMAQMANKRSENGHHENHSDEGRDNSEASKQGGTNPLYGPDDRQDSKAMAESPQQVPSGPVGERIPLGKGIEGVQLRLF